MKVNFHLQATLIVKKLGMCFGTSHTSPITFHVRFLRNRKLDVKIERIANIIQIRAGLSTVSDIN
jgi:hypothetical protein